MIAGFVTFNSALFVLVGPQVQSSGCGLVGFERDSSGSAAEGQVPS